MARRLLLAAFVLTLAAVPGRAQVVQVIQTVTAAAASVTITPKMPGDTLLVQCDYNAVLTLTSGISDSLGTAYTPIGGINASSTLSQILAISAPLPTTAADTVKCPGAAAEVYVVELGGAAISHTFIQTNGGSSPASASLITSVGDKVLAFCVTGTCSPLAGWTTLSTFDSNLVASKLASATKVSASFTTSRDWVLTLVALEPPPPVVTGPLQITFPGSGGGSGITATFPIANASQVPACTAADGVCSIAVQVCDGATPPNCLTGNAGSLSLVKTVSLPLPTSTKIPIVLAVPSP